MNEDMTERIKTKDLIIDQLRARVRELEEELRRSKRPSGIGSLEMEEIEHRASLGW